jgi:hypothetical protein
VQPPRRLRRSIYQGIKYCVPHWGAFSGRRENGQYIEARRAETDKLLWDLRIYKVNYDPTLESDVQDIFITSLKLVEGNLEVMNEAGDKFVVDLSKRAVIKGANREYARKSGSAMFQYLLLGYIVLYTVIAVGMFSLHVLIVPSEEKKDDKAWETPLDIVLALFGLAGMLLLYLRFEPVWLKQMWIPLSIAVALTQVWLALRGRRSRAEVDPGTVRAADLTTFLFLAPSLLLNFLYAFR